MEISDYGVPSFNVQKRTGAVRYIVVHYTANGRPSTANAAKSNCVYFNNANRNASAHFFIDDSAIWQFADPERWSCWHVGDGGGAYGITNQNSVGIEVVQDGDNPFSDAETAKLAWLVQRLMAQFSVPAERVVRHYDASRKACPLWYTPSGSGGDAAWESLRKRITSKSETKVVTDMASLRDQIVAKAREELNVSYYSMNYSAKDGYAEGMGTHYVGKGWGCAMLASKCFNTVLGTRYKGSCFCFAGDALGQSVNQGGGEFEFIDASEAQPGDCVLYGQPGYNGKDYDDYGHIAVYVGNGRIIGAMGSGKPGTSGYLNIGIKETTVSGQSLGGVIRYIRCTRLKGDSPTPTKEMFPVNKTITVYSDGLNVRDKPSTKTGKVVAEYAKGDKVTIDGVVLGDDGYMWGHYIGASSGKDRYIALGDMELAR